MRSVDRIVIDPVPPPVAYRYWETPERQEAFSRGEIHLTTLEICRGIESQVHRDEGEAIHTHLISDMVDQGNDPGFERGTRQAGIRIVNSPGTRVSRVFGSTKIFDAYVLCLTLNSPATGKNKFGSYYATIRKPNDLFLQITAQLEKNHPIAGGYFGRVRYADRTTLDRQLANGPIGFVKPKEKYGAEAELRMLWPVPTAASVGRIVVNVL